MVRRLCIPLAAVVLAVGGRAAAQPRSTDSRAHLVLAGRSPLKIRGAGFHRRERVRIVARFGAGARMTRRVRADRAGRIAVTFPGGSSPPCGHLRVSATGSLGSRARIAGIKMPDCVVA